MTDYRDRNWLETEYLNNNRTMHSIATECGVSSMTIQNWLDRHSIPTRPRGRRSSASTPRVRDSVMMVSKKDYQAMQDEIESLRSRVSAIITNE